MSEQDQPEINLEIGDNVQIAGSVIVNTGTMTTIMQAAQTLTSLHQLRAPLGDFVGREAERAKLCAELSPQPGQARVAAIIGMGGLGKTELALHVAYDLREIYPDAQLFLSLRGSATTARSPADVLREAIRAFEPYATLPDDIEALAAHYRGHLGSRRAIVLVDDAPDDASARVFLPPAGCALIVTSRTRLTLGGQSTLVDLALFERNEARTLLLDDAPHLSNDPSLESLLNYCGDLPLAVRVAGAVLADHTITPERYLARLADEKRRPNALRYEDTDVYAILAASADTLAEQHATLVRRWQMLGVCPAPFDALAAAAIWQETDQDACDDALALLTRRSLLRYDWETRQYHMHDLLRDIAAQRRTLTEDAAARLCHAVHYLVIAHEAQRLYQQGHENILVGLKIFDANWQHIRAGATFVARTSTPEGDKLLIAFVLEAYELVFLRTLPRDLQIWFTATLEVAQRHTDRTAEGRALVGIGSALRLQRASEAAHDHFTRGLALAQVQGDAQGAGNALIGLGNLAYEANNPEEARAFYTQALAMMEQGAEQRGRGQALASLSIACQALNQIEPSLNYAYQSLEIAQQLGDEKTEAIVLNAIGMIFCERKHSYTEATDFYTRSLHVFEHLGDQAGAATVSFNLFECLRASGQLEAALPYLQQAVAIEQVIGHPQAVEDTALLEQLRTTAAKPTATA